MGACRTKWGVWLLACRVSAHDGGQGSECARCRCGSEVRETEKEREKGGKGREEHAIG